MLTGNKYFNIHPYKIEEEIYPLLDLILKLPHATVNNLRQRVD